jgi:hypothetical protein
VVRIGDFDVVLGSVQREKTLFWANGENVAASGEWHIAYFSIRNTGTQPRQTVLLDWKATDGAGRELARFPEDRHRSAAFGRGLRAFGETLEGSQSGTFFQPFDVPAGATGLRLTHVPSGNAFDLTPR